MSSRGPRTAMNTSALHDPNNTQPLEMAEHWWRDRYNAISEQGYILHPQYHPQWGSSWSKIGKDLHHPVDHGQTQVTISKLGAAMDANRKQDSHPVILKKVLPNEAPHELRINRLFSSPELSRNLDSHCAPLLDVITLPAHFGFQELMVLPLLRPFNRPQIQTFRKFCAFFTQICEGHPIHASAKCRPPVVVQRRRFPRYYFIDFGLSRQYPSRDAMDEPLPGRDESVPEHQYGRRQPCNSFHTDIYYIGNVVRKEFMEKYNGFEFMENLVASMTQEDPALRPLIEDVLQEFSHIKGSLSKRKLRSAIISKTTPKILGIIWQAWQSFRGLRYVVSFRPAILNQYS
ncbi:hypothetical protein V8E53_004854 [Lactarius tabidus]